jgi:hypothetical protein
MGVLWSISEPCGSLGVGSHEHVGAGQLGIVGNGGVLVVKFRQARDALDTWQNREALVNNKSCVFDIVRLERAVQSAVLKREQSGFPVLGNSGLYACVIHLPTDMTSCSRIKCRAEQKTHSLLSRNNRVELPESTVANSATMSRKKIQVNDESRLKIYPWTMHLRFACLVSLCIA